jgi:hypothetical protein
LLALVRLCTKLEVVPTAQSVGSVHIVELASVVLLRELVSIAARVIVAILCALRSTGDSLRDKLRTTHLTKSVLVVTLTQLLALVLWFGTESHIIPVSVNTWFWAVVQFTLVVSERELIREASLVIITELSTVLRLFDVGLDFNLTRTAVLAIHVLIPIHTGFGAVFGRLLTEVIASHNVGMSGFLVPVEFTALGHHGVLVRVACRLLVTKFGTLDGVTNGGLGRD